MWRLALRDLQWRKRRFVISILSTSLVFTIALILAGVAGSFGAEAQRAINAFGADFWVVHADTPGPFSSGLPIPESEVNHLLHVPGVTATGGLIYALQSIGLSTRPTNVNLFGVSPGRLGMPSPDQGRQPTRDSEAMTDDSLPFTIGQHFILGGRSFMVVGRLHHSTLLAGTPNVFVTLRAAQQLIFQGQPEVTAILVRGAPHHALTGYRILSLSDVHADMTRALAKAQQVVTFIELFLWLIAASIIGSVVFISALEKTRDFAVLKATGSSDLQLISSLTLQAIVISLGAALLAGILASLVVPTFPLVVSIPAWSMLALPILAVGIGLLASLAGLRRVISVQPAAAFGGP